MTEFGGKTINGEITRYTNGPKAQDDPQVFLDALDAILAVPGIEAVKWQQYTPYFNDGEPCIFRIYTAYVRITGDDPEVGDYADGFRSTYELYDYVVGERYVRKFNPIAGYDSKAIYDALAVFEDVLSSGSHYTVLNDKFGDPAEVVARTDGFTVEFYEHD